jgi:hypothetical protein
MDGMDSPLEPIGIDRPSSARMYDYFLGGSHNFAVDRAAAEQALAGFPGLALGMHANRAFLRRAVRFLVESDVDQFLDLGSGIPTVGNVHEVAQAINPQARVAYVDIEPIAVRHSLALLADNPFATAIQADLRHPDEVLAHPTVRDILDLSRPVGVLLVGTMHFIADADDPAGICAGYRDAIVPGSYFALTQGTSEGQTQAMTESALEVYKRSPTPLNLRGREETLAMMAGYELVEPGLVGVREWRPDEPTDIDLPFAWVAVGRKP